MTRWPASLRARLTLWYTVFLAVPLILFALGCYLFFASTLRTRTDEFIADALTAFSRELHAERRIASSPVDAIGTTVAEVRFRDLHIAVFDSVGSAVATSATDRSDPDGDQPDPTLDARISAARARALPTVNAVTLPTGNGDYRALWRTVPLGGREYVVTGTYALRDTDEMLERVRTMFLFAIPLLVLCAATAGSVLAKRGLAPVATIGSHAARISIATLHERIPVDGPTELTALARVVNDLLDRLSDAFARQRQFVADASHELRTPATIMRTESEVTLSREHRPEEEYRASMAVMHGASQRLGRIVDDLFLLARADSGHLDAHHAPLYLEDLVDEATRAVRSVAQERGIAVALAGIVEAPFNGDADLIGRAILNLLDNAIKHSPAGAEIGVSLTRTGRWFDIVVIDAGPGIPEPMHTRVFERFFRADAARSRTESSATSGAGLGLPIARRIAELHGGKLDLVESRPGRTVFRLRLPDQAEIPIF